MLIGRKITLLKRWRLPRVCDEKPAAERSWVSWADVETVVPEGQPPVGGRRVPKAKPDLEPQLKLDTPAETKRPPVIRPRGTGPMELGG